MVMPRSLHLPLEVVLGEPSGFCAGVVRAIRAVEEALARYGAPVYVRHAIVHNAWVLRDLEARGAVFVEDLAECPPDRPLILSAHGTPRAVSESAMARQDVVVDATCPLVRRVHTRVRAAAAQGRETVLVGHDGHQEVRGTVGQAPGRVHVVADADEVSRLDLDVPDTAILAVQTTLSVDDAAQTVAALRERFPGIETPRRSDICYATTNRQEVVKALVPEVDEILVLGDPTSSNSCRLVETARAAGGMARLISDPETAAVSATCRRLGVVAGASSPVAMREALLARLEQARDIRVRLQRLAEEDTVFAPARLPA